MLLPFLVRRSVTLSDRTHPLGLDLRRERLPAVRADQLLLAAIRAFDFIAAAHFGDGHGVFFPNGISTFISDFLKSSATPTRVSAPTF